MAASKIFYDQLSLSLWQFKPRKVEMNDKEDCPSFFETGLWQKGFFGCDEAWYHFQQEQMVSKMVV